MAAHAPPPRSPRSAPSANAPAFCGLWPGPRRATAVLFDTLTQHQRALTLANTALAHTTLLDWLVEQNAHLVIPDTLLAASCLNQASQIPIAVWIAPSPLLEAIRLAAGLTTRPPKQTAALLARWPTAPALRPFLRRVIAPRIPDQLSLL
jgi:hypothetical protein